jgi:hypothetical protein
MNQEELRALIRERIRTGQLPPVLGAKTFAGRGSNTPCDCCGQIISRQEIEYEVEVDPSPTDSTRSWIAHTQCHWIWWEESGSQSIPPEPMSSQSLAWSALKESVERTGPSAN